MQDVGGNIRTDRLQTLFMPIMQGFQAISVKELSWVVCCEQRWTAARWTPRVRTLARATA